MEPLGVYISAPFCRSKCTFCNFASGVHSSASQELYVSRLCSEIRSVRKRLRRWAVELPRRVDSIYLGGGTPSILTAAQLRALWKELRSEFEIAPGAEVTLECAPGQLAEETLQSMIACGVDRVSFGVQSFVDREASAVGRLHSRKIAFSDLARVRAAGISRINFDLIAGLPYQTSESWQGSLAALTETGAGHASIYMLEVDAESHLGREALTGGGRYHTCALPGDELIADFYESAVAWLEKHGLKRYEISNFARPGSESRHNLRYWRRQPYIGFGLDAHSFLRSRAGSFRFETVGILEEYLDPSAGQLTVAGFLPYHSVSGGTLSSYHPANLRKLSSREELEETWFLGLRTREGVRWASVGRQFGESAISRCRPIVEELCQLGLLHDRDGLVCLTPRGVLLSNDVFARFLDLPDFPEAGQADGEMWKEAAVER